MTAVDQTSRNLQRRFAAVTFAAIGSVVTDYLALKPEGPFYGVFAPGAHR